jgi:hypothetical protein
MQRGVCAEGKGMDGQDVVDDSGLYETAYRAHVWLLLPLDIKDRFPKELVAWSGVGVGVGISTTILIPILRVVHPRVLRAVHVHVHLVPSLLE